MKEVNLEKILFSEIKINLEEIQRKYSHGFSEEQWIDLKNSFPYPDMRAAMKEVCKQTLELAAENATTTLHKSGKQIKVVTPILEPQYYEKGNGDLVPQGYAQVGTRTQLKYENELVVVDKDSILNTINQII